MIYLPYFDVWKLKIFPSHISIVLLCSKFHITELSLRLQSTAPKAADLVNLYFKTVTDIHLKQVAVQQQMKEIHFSGTKKRLF